MRCKLWNSILKLIHVCTQKVWHQCLSCEDSRILDWFWTSPCKDFWPLWPERMIVFIRRNIPTTFPLPIAVGCPAGAAFPVATHLHFPFTFHIFGLNFFLNICEHTRMSSKNCGLQVSHRLESHLRLGRFSSKFDNNLKHWRIQCGPCGDWINSSTQSLKDPDLRIPRGISLPYSVFAH